MGKLFQHLIFLHFILNYLILILLVCWMISLNSHLRGVINNTLIYLEIKIFSVINLIIYISFNKELFTRDSRTTSSYLLFWSEKPNCITDHWYPHGSYPGPFWVNLYISKYKCDFMCKLIKEDIARAKTFHETFRFIDDI